MNNGYNGYIGDMNKKQTFKEYIAEQCIGKSAHFICDCIFPFDIIGKIVGYKIHDNEIIFSVMSDQDNKIIEIGENHPKLFIE